MKLSNLGKLFKKYGTKSRTALIGAITGNKKHKSSTRQKELRTVKKESSGMKRILNFISKPLKKENETVKVTRELRKKKIEQYKKYGRTSIKEVLQEKKAEKITKKYKEINIPHGYEDIKNNITVRVKLNQKNNSGTNFFSIGMDKDKHKQIESATPREKMNILEGMIQSMIAENNDKYKEININNGIQITDIDGWFGFDNDLGEGGFEDYVISDDEWY